MKRSFLVVGLVVLVAATVYAVSPIFIHTRVDEAAPVSGNAPASPVVGTVGHPASGTVRRIEAEGKQYLRYEDFSTLNGPDLYVYLANDLDATEYVSLGRLKATEGNVNYEIPAHIDTSRYRYALVWCKAFGVLFNSADLASTMPVR